MARQQPRIGPATVNLSAPSVFIPNSESQLWDDVTNKLGKKLDEAMEAQGFEEGQAAQEASDGADLIKGNPLTTRGRAATQGAAGVFLPSRRTEIDTQLQELATTYEDDPVAFQKQASNLKKKLVSSVTSDAGVRAALNERFSGLVGRHTSSINTNVIRRQQESEIADRVERVGYLTNEIFVGISSGEVKGEDYMTPSGATAGELKKNFFNTLKSYRRTKVQRLVRSKRC